MDKVYDLLVIGGGINGAGIARDAAMRGLSVCLVEKEDLGWATSARSSMLAHGGLRYLEQFEFGLVHEALQDRERMLKQAPHLVRPLRFFYPVYPEVANRRIVRVGLFLYDMLSHGKSVPGRDWHDREEVLGILPHLSRDGLKGAASYTDAQITSVERLVIELVTDAEAHGATILNHTAVTDLTIEDIADPSGTRHRTCTGAATADGRIRARATVNAAGTWVDAVLGPISRSKKVRTTKGIHVAVPRFQEDALIVRAVDGRTFFVLPWKDVCLIGTTDTDYEGDAGDVAANADDVRYLLESARAYLPHAPLEPLYTYAGVRALVNQEGLTESNVTRRHILFDHRDEGVHALWSLQGGKITTYRSLAEMCVDRVARHLGRSDLARSHPTRTGTLPGGPLVPWEDFRHQAIETAKAMGIEATHLIDTYGARWQQVLAAGEARRIDRSVPDLWCQVDFAMRYEHAATVADVMLRRTHMGRAAGGRMKVAKKVASHMARLLGWDRDRRSKELERYEEQVAAFAVPIAVAATQKSQALEDSIHADA